MLLILFWRKYNEIAGGIRNGIVTGSCRERIGKRFAESHGCSLRFDSKSTNKLVTFSPMEFNYNIFWTLSEQCTALLAWFEFAPSPPLRCAKGCATSDILPNPLRCSIVHMFYCSLIRSMLTAPLVSPSKWCSPEGAKFVAHHDGGGRTGGGAPESTSKFECSLAL
jgi:hypothetical protein